MPDVQSVTHPVFGDVTYVPADIIKTAEEYLPNNANAKQRETALNFIKSFKESPDFEIMKQANGGSQAEPTKQPDKKVVTQPAKKEEEGNDKSFADEIKNPYLKTKGKNATPKIEVKSLDDVTKLIKEKYNMDDVGTFIDTYDKQRENAQKANKFKDELDVLNNFYESLPKNYRDGLLSYGKGEGDYKKYFREDGIDFNKAFEEQDKKGLIAHYMPEVTDEIDFTDSKNKVVEQSLKKLYQQDVQRQQTELTSSAAKVKARIDGYNNARQATVQALTQSFPDLESDQKGAITKILNSNDLIRDLGLIDKDGNFTADAAEKIFWLKYGKQTADDAYNLYELQKGQTEKLVSKKSDRLPDRQGNGELETNDEDLRKEVEQETGLAAPRQWKKQPAQT